MDGEIPTEKSGVHRRKQKPSFSQKILVLISVLLVLISLPYRNQDKSKWKAKQNSVSMYPRGV